MTAAPITPSAARAPVDPVAGPGASPVPVVPGRFVLAAPHPALLPYLGQYVGYTERADGW